MGNYKKVLPLAVAMALAACGGGSDSSVPDQSIGSTRVGTHPVFNPAASQLPLNTDLVFAGSTDGTADVGVATNPVTAALNKLDGFSTSAYFDIAFEGDAIDPASVCVPSDGSCTPNVYLVPLATSDDDALPITANFAPDSDASHQPAYSASVESLDGGTNNVLRVIPEQPLLAKTKYLVFITNGLRDEQGDPMEASYQYDLLGGPDDSSLIDSLQSVQKAVHGWEALAAAVMKGNPADQAAKDSVVISYTFTTTDPVAPLVAMGAPRAAVVKAQVDAGVPPANAVTNAGNLEMGGLLSTPKARDLGVSAMSGVDFGTLTQGQLSGGGKLYTGYIKLPYYLSAPAAASDYSFLQKSWNADQVLGSQLGAGVPPQDVDGSYNVTYRYPFAAKTGIEDVPLQVTLPDATQTPSELGGASCANVRDNTGYPVVIYVHGITSDRTSVIALAHSLATKCVATVAIDLPMHGVPANSDFVNVLNVEHGVNPVNGKSYSEIYPDNAPHERHFEIVQDAAGNPAPMNFANPSDDFDGSGSWFINLANLPNTRDNLRESVMDLMNLNASLGAISDLNIDGNGTLDLDNVKVIGVSLGGIVGTVFASANQQAIASLQQINSATGASFVSNLNPLKGLLVSSGGSQVTQILNNSPTFAPRIQAGLAVSGVKPHTSDYEKFLYVAQSTVASGDPLNFAQTLVGDTLSGAGLGMPVLVQQIVGGGDTDTSGLGESDTPLPDQVVPPVAEGAPLAGVTALAKLLDTTQVGAGGYDLTASDPGPRLLVNLKIGQHASLLTTYPDEEGDSKASDKLATAELQTEAVTFVLSPASSLAVGSAPGGSNTAASFIQVPAP
ncbi:putative lipoprotein [Alcanivorax hongdengensis A-11-3]|uniref:Putative lipoprotein n=1 Tax=Alcanivorax hongdengensis A-11-3 TaxID=1177179 RepID=L0WE09_9GAMM|nr:putative lipoprotein [Alcanivorax hongdengensis]EKF75281.1 putative lipoprotein [Alcanivorax hongdengensis A-11-3]